MTKPAQAPFSYLPEKLTSTPAMSYSSGRDQGKESLGMILLRMKDCYLDHCSRLAGGMRWRFQLGSGYIIKEYVMRALNAIMEVKRKDIERGYDVLRQFVLHEGCVSVCMQSSLCQNAIYFIFRNKMSESNQNLQTPPKGPRPTHPILSIANNSVPAQNSCKPLPIYSQVDHFSFGASSCQRDGTQRKIKIVSASPPPLPKTEKKRQFIKLLSPLSRKDKQGEEEYEESAIADEQTPEESQEEEGQFRASLNYFEKEVGRMGEELRGIAQEAIEEEQRIVMMSQRVSHQQIPINHPQQKQTIPLNEQNQSLPKKKIILSSSKYPRPPPLSSTVQIKPIFRYCIGCQQPILQANVPLHQSQCLSFQQIFKMDYKQIGQLLQGMVGGLAQRIDQMRQGLTERDLERLKASLGELLRESHTIGQGKEGGMYSFGRSLSAVERESKKWVSLAEQVCRLNWFITLRQAIHHLPPIPQ